jgi:3-hydroxymyristoyl/3-hydroxydecanoyl-(acyl carrier protein) dehydratase
MMQLPRYQLLESSPTRVVLRMSLAPDLHCFEGHFEGLPVLAGVVQVGWALDLARLHFEHPLVFRGLRSSKFQKLVRPPAQLNLTLDLLAERELLKFRYDSQRGVCSSGGITVAGTN